MDLTEFENWSKSILPLPDIYWQNELIEWALFLKVRPGNAVLYEADQLGKVLKFISCSRAPDVPALFQIRSLDSGEIRWVLWWGSYRDSL